MNFVVTTAQMKMAEDVSQLNGVSKYQLMENAGTALAKAIEETVGTADKSFVILSGKGNNGGDGIVLGQRLGAVGAQVLVILTAGEPVTPEASTALGRYRNACPTAFYENNPEAARAALAAADVIVDCVFGTGFRGQLDGGTAELFAFINELPDPVRVSVDIPSGVNGDSGEVSHNAFAPHYTFTLGAMKQGLLNYPCNEHCGKIRLLDIGIAESCFREYTAQLTDDSILKFQIKRPRDSNKGSYGRFLNIAGSGCYMGAAVLSTRAALRTGAGLVTLAAPKEVVAVAAAAVPEAEFLPLEQDANGFMDRNSPKRLASQLANATAAAIGCGIGNTESGRIIVKAVLQTGDCPLILDADGINCAADNINVLKGSKRQLVLTPHPGEFSRLTGLSVQEIRQNRLALARAFAREKNVVLLLKGADTVIASPDGRTFVNTTGNPALAKAGCGDVLTGIIGGFLAQGIEPFFAAALGAYVHGKCADRLVESASAASVLASDIIESLPYVLS